MSRSVVKKLYHARIASICAYHVFQPKDSMRIDLALTSQLNSNHPSKSLFFILTN